MSYSPSRDNSNQQNYASRRSADARRVDCFTQLSALTKAGAAIAVAVALWFSIEPATGQLKKKKPAPAAKTKAEPEPKWINLIDPKTFPAGWRHQSGRAGSKLGETWSIDDADKNDPILVCTGKPTGYLHTTEEYEDFELSLEWMYHTDSCNSGILLNIAKPNKIWPAAIQMQLHRPTVGSIIRTPDPRPKLPIPLKRDNIKLANGKWHKCTITSRDGTISISINDQKVGEVKNFEPKKGFIALQSEGSEIHFRRIQIRTFKRSTASTMVKTKKKTESKKPDDKKKSKTPTT